MSTYAQHLESAKVAALAALFELLVTTEDPIEKRRIATTLLRIADPKPTRATDRGSGGERSVQATRDSRTNTNSPSPELPTQDTGPSTQDVPSPHPTSDIPHPTSLPLPSLTEINAELTRLSARRTRSPHHDPPSLLAAAGALSTD